MKKNGFLAIVIIFLLTIFIGCTANKKLIHQQLNDTIISGLSSSGVSFDIEFFVGKAHNHPTFTVWTETMSEEFVETLFVTKFIGTGVFGYAPTAQGEWQRQPGRAMRPAALPYWMHKHGGKGQKEIKIPTPENPEPDAITGATPKAGFLLKTNASQPYQEKFRLLVEVNQTWDWNEYWTNSLYPNDVDYKTSCQPSVIYAVTIDPANPQQEYYLNPIGHGHYSGKDGKLYTDISSLTTALHIFDRVVVRCKK